MTVKDDFTESEWVKLYRAPIVAGLGVSLADPGGPIEISKEAMAAIRSAAAPTTGQGLVVDLAKGLSVVLEERQNPVADLKPQSGTDPREMILEELREAIRIITEKATSEEATDYRTWVLESARSAADAAKEGGFFGMGAELVSERERQILATFEEMLDADAS